MEECQFDAVIFGTGLVESMTAAALSKAGYKVAHIDVNPYYGGDEASLSLEEFVQWADQASSSSSEPSSPPSRFQRVSRSPGVPPQSRQYSICLQPAVIPSTGPLIASLVSSGCAKYSGFRLVDCVSMYDSSGRVKSVPGSKEDIFKSKEISLIEKRRLMRFLTFAAGDLDGRQELEGKRDMPFVEFLKTTFTLSDDIANVIAYSLAYCMSTTEPTLPTLRRLQRYLRSAGRYGPSPFLIGHYGCLGDIAQGFCRAAAVSGGVYILGRKVTNISRALPTKTEEKDGLPSSSDEKEKLAFNYDIDLEDFPDTLSCNLIISSPTYIPSALKEETLQVPPPSRKEFDSNVSCLARCVAILDQALALRTQDPQRSAPERTEEDEEDSQTAETALKGVGVDTAILVFPPSSVTGGSTAHSATVLINGEGSLSTPKDRWLVYITLPLSQQPEASISAEVLLKPYLDALLLLSADPSHSLINPLFTTFYLENPAPPSTTPGSSLHAESNSYLVPAPLPLVSLPDFPDEAALNAESTFKKAIKVLRSVSNENKEDEELDFWPPLPSDEDADDDNEW
ncbi:hypothetical protein NLJ89_g9414 [Agrocybe chaxingu]|uniref:Rab proteins geranylgeranyltransferase component A n=1 Tax=Agrocybe chaxingu TaxID=84603 RepID=A0A9W8MT50_9AGAR|nr:hypothetical protein NLJ89_g9414 [Agrocybe chaxingu]